VGKRSWQDVYDSGRQEKQAEVLCNLLATIIDGGLDRESIFNIMMQNLEKESCG
jgi:hypothetical protein